jgi:hypothetical protein
MASISFTQRLQDLTEHIAKDLALLKAVENAWRFERDPLQKDKYQWDIAHLRESAHRYQQEYDSLNQQVTTEMHTVAEQLRQMDGKLDSVLGGQVAIVQQLSQMQHVLLSRYGETELSLVSAVVEQLDDQQLSMTQALLDALESHQLAESEVQEMWAVLEERLPELPPSQDAVKDWLRAPGLDARHRLKVALPIVPFLVDYEAEFELNGGLDFKTLWETMKAKLRKPKQSAHKPVWQVAREIRQGLSDDDLRRLPSDGAVNHDHYIYGTPKIDS